MLTFTNAQNMVLITNQNTEQIKNWGDDGATWKLKEPLELLNFLTEKNRNINLVKMQKEKFTKVIRNHPLCTVNGD